MSVNPAAFLYLLLGLAAVIALAMCAAGAKALEYNIRLPRLAWLRSWLVYTEPQQLWAGWDWARGWVADAQARVGPGRNPGERGLTADQRVAPPTATWTRQAITHTIATIPPMDVETFTRRAAQYRQAMTDAQRWPELQRQWSDSTGEFAALIDATGGA